MTQNTQVKFEGSSFNFQGSRFNGTKPSSYQPGNSSPRSSNASILLQQYPPKQSQYPLNGYGNPASKASMRYMSAQGAEVPGPLLGAHIINSFNLATPYISPIEQCLDTVDYHCLLHKNNPSLTPSNNESIMNLVLHNSNSLAGYYSLANTFYSGNYNPNHSAPKADVGDIQNGPNYQHTDTELRHCSFDEAYFNHTDNISYPLKPEYPTSATDLYKHNLVPPTRNGSESYGLSYSSVSPTSSSSSPNHVNNHVQPSKPRYRPKSRLSIGELSLILKKSPEDTVLIEHMILKTLEEVTNSKFRLGYSNWVRGLSIKQRKDYLDRLYVITSKEFPTYDKKVLEIIVGRGSYSYMQKRLRQERESRRKSVNGINLRPHPMER
ncbi:hypothetical protein BABINDRAFT_162955 [Babjeviella inositovora NRRL Y-12698]|uniref:Uncharacterized protein n=1 Tax=Babjeviella inositovora NRRL Y-12698 TaxID=984486 RepID=A0A1E3QL14_9ASCO|nr:uncharacterized protein BABINDRAFT_162955 [Babjeviella inositovora NRRL Y-12698]ODQ78308.1 hypothetical protein BABINDRAFT_162955 [Babjeviella inositovora NRRL Y-12698]